MARIRTIKPEAFEDAKLARVSHTARWLFAALWTYADDDGRAAYNEKRIEAYAFPHESVSIPGVLRELSGSGFIHRYEVGGEPYLHIPNFLKHQRIEKPTRSKLPSPEGVCPCCIGGNSGRTPGGLREDSGKGRGREVGTEEREREVGIGKESVAASVPSPPARSPEENDPLPFSEPLDPVPDDLPEVELEAKASDQAQGEQSVGQQKGAARPVRAVPKPKRGVYTPAFEAWWAAYPGGGKKGEAFAEWRAAGLERDEDLRERVEQALAAQVEDRAKCAASGAWYPEWCDAERWLKNGRWEDKMRAAPGQLRPVAPGRPVHRGAGNQNVPDDVIIGFLKRHGGA